MPASNGTVTLEAALVAAGIGPEDEVIVPPITFIATATATLRVGATLVFADIGQDYNIDPRRVEEVISERSRAIIVVHYAGRPADMDAIAALAAKHHLLVVEDAAQAHADLAKHLIGETCRRFQPHSGQLTIHADCSSSMADRAQQQRQAVLTVACQHHSERFVRRHPKPFDIPRNLDQQAAIDRPKCSANSQRRCRPAIYYQYGTNTTESLPKFVTYGIYLLP